MHFYLDFESNVAGDLFIAGELVDGEFRQVVLDPRLEDLAPLGTRTRKKIAV